MRLLEAIQSLGEIEIANLSAILISPRDGQIVAKFSISCNLPHAADPELPDSIRMLGFERWPDQERVLDWQVALPAQITEVRQSAIVGGLDIYQRGPDSWAITTHAGSDIERQKWVMRR